VFRTCFDFRSFLHFSRSQLVELVTGYLNKSKLSLRTQIFASFVSNGIHDTQPNLFLHYYFFAEMKFRWYWATHIFPLLAFTKNHSLVIKNSQLNRNIHFLKDVLHVLIAFNFSQSFCGSAIVSIIISIQSLFRIYCVSLWDLFSPGNLRWLFYLLIYSQLDWCLQLHIINLAYNIAGLWYTFRNIA